MYRDHQPIIARWARARPENLARVIQFAIVSARIRFYNVPDAMERADQGDPGALFAYKAEGIACARERAEEVYHNCEEIARLAGNRRERGTLLVRYLAATLPGLGLAKAGFAAQMAYGCAGCLDTVNARRLSLPTAIFNSNRRYRMKRQSDPGRRFRLAAWYVATCERLGGPGILWDQWCEEISRLYPNAFPTPDAASAHHLECLGLT